MSYWTENSTQLLRWMVSGPEIARLVNDFQADVNIVKRRHEVVENKRHHEQTNSLREHLRNKWINCAKSLKIMEIHLLRVIRT